MCEWYGTFFLVFRSAMLPCWKISLGNVVGPVNLFSLGTAEPM